jgi:hypothetical protein
MVDVELLALGVSVALLALLALGVSVALLTLMQETWSKAKQDLPLQLEEVLHDPQKHAAFSCHYSTAFFQSNEITIFGKTVYLLVGLTIKLVVHFGHVVVFVFQVALQNVCQISKLELGCIYTGDYQNVSANIGHPVSR